MTAKRWAVDTKSTKTITIYTPTGQLHARRVYATEAGRQAILTRHQVGKVHAN
jgi:hypothetical protein